MRQSSCNEGSFFRLWAHGPHNNHVVTACNHRFDKKKRPNHKPIGKYLLKEASRKSLTSQLSVPPGWRMIRRRRFSLEKFFNFALRFYFPRWFFSIVFVFLRSFKMLEESFSSLPKQKLVIQWNKSFQFFMLHKLLCTQWCFPPLTSSAPPHTFGRFRLNNVSKKHFPKHLNGNQY